MAASRRANLANSPREPNLPHEEEYASESSRRSRIRTVVGPTPEAIMGWVGAGEQPCDPNQSRLEQTHSTSLGGGCRPVFEPDPNSARNDRHVAPGR